MNSTSKFWSLNLRHFSTLPQRKSWTFHHPSCSAGGTPITGWNIYVSDDGLTYPSTPTACYPEIHIFVFHFALFWWWSNFRAIFFSRKARRRDRGWRLQNRQPSFLTPWIVRTLVVWIEDNSNLVKEMEFIKNAITLTQIQWSDLYF